MALRNFVKMSRKIVCVGRNYTEHAKELGNPSPGEPVIFIKPTSAYLTEGCIRLPPARKEIHYETELGVVIGRGGSAIPLGEGGLHIGGYCLALDMTDRQSQTEAKQSGLPWTLAKGFDTSCPVSGLVAKEAVSNVKDLRLELLVNDKLVQSGSVSDMTFSVDYLISYVSDYMTWETGDLLLTGTPKGVGPVTHGDRLHGKLIDERNQQTLTEMRFSVE